jgi:hypothetical protein
MPRHDRMTRGVAALLTVALLGELLAGCSAIPNASQLASGTAGAPSSGRVASDTIDRSQPYDASQLDPRVRQETVHATIGVSGWSSRVRPPESVTGRIKRALMRQHGYTDPLSDYELDHFIPLSVGGSSNLSNLWLEPIAEAKRKDADEATARRNVISGSWTLGQGQQYIRDRWRIHYAR